MRGHAARWRRRRANAPSARPRPTSDGIVAGAVLGTVEQEQPPPSIEVSSGAAPHVLVVLSQWGAVLGQLVSSTQPTHIIVFGSQIGAVPGQSELFEHVVPHVCELPLQIGAPGLHSPLLVQPTQP